METKRIFQISARLDPEKEDWLRDYLYYKQITTGNTKLNLTNVLNEAIACFWNQNQGLVIESRPDFIRKTERKIRRVYKPK